MATSPVPTPRIEAIPSRRLVGLRVCMSMADDRTAELWGRFMPRRREIQDALGSELYSAEVYEPDYFDAFDPTRELEKWAAVAVSGAGGVPEGMSLLTVPAGLHAVFRYRGPASGAAAIYGHIYGTWLPASEYVLGPRPHFAVMGEAYRGEDPRSEEEIWIPIEREAG